MARPQKCRCICSKPQTTRFVPENGGAGPAVTLGYDEYEVIRLLDHVRLTQEQCALKMRVSRTTVTRMYDAARRKIAEALVCGKGIEIAGGDVIVCAGPRPQCSQEPHCCHRSSGNKEETA